MKGRVINAETGVETHEEPHPEAWRIPDNILGTGQLQRTKPGVMTGAVTFLVRGERPASMTIGGKVNDQWSATLRIGRDECQMLLFPPDVKGMFDAKADKPSSWHGYIRIEGYAMRVDISTDGAVVLLDSKQPMPLSAEALAALGEVA